jgi:hypothetical protein
VTGARIPGKKGERRFPQSATAEGLGPGGGPT